MKLDNLVDSLGRPLPQELQADLNKAILRTITQPDSDIPAVIQRAQTIARRAIDGEIRNVLHYATKALFAVSRKQQRLSQREIPQPPEVIIEFAGHAVQGSVAAIEAKVLLDQLLNDLPPTERQVFLRHTMGWRHKRIAQELNISAAMSSYYLLRAKAHLDGYLRTQRNSPAGSGR